ncbi:MAG: hypothetical protein QNJ72_23855 [Pleurocapsa sp. MO_226.B13]|nr:hypothetical protein [Pleurocapsa sp. MO_226.B13]
MQIKDSQQKDSQKINISQQEAQAWKQEAIELGRSQSHLKKIDQTINNAPKTNIGKEQGLTLDRKDALAMKKDRSDFQELKLNNNQSQNQTEQISQSKGIRR